MWFWRLESEVTVGCFFLRSSASSSALEGESVPSLSQFLGFGWQHLVFLGLQKHHPNH
jgi:hypothetical protein